MSQSDCISPRGIGFLPDAPKFFDVLNDLWDPETNPEGIVNLGLAENVGIRYVKRAFELIDTGADANGNDLFH